MCRFQAFAFPNPTSSYILPLGGIQYSPYTTPYAAVGSAILVPLLDERPQCFHIHTREQQIADKGIKHCQMPLIVAGVFF
jgi:hypothetical protein